METKINSNISINISKESFVYRFTSIVAKRYQISYADALDMIFKVLEDEINFSNTFLEEFLELDNPTFYKKGFASLKDWLYQCDIDKLSIFEIGAH